jgi:endoribonuclease L-PSP
VLEAGGSTLRDIAKVTIFLTDMGNFPKIVELREKWFSEPYPADTIIEVAALAFPSWRSRSRRSRSCAVDETTAGRSFGWCSRLRRDADSLSTMEPNGAFSNPFESGIRTRSTRNRGLYVAPWLFRFPLENERMELAGLEPATSWVRSRRSPN